MTAITPIPAAATRPRITPMLALNRSSPILPEKLNHSTRQRAVDPFQTRRTGVVFLSTQQRFAKPGDEAKNIRVGSTLPLEYETATQRKLCGCFF